MKIYVKVKKSVFQKIENFGNGRYLVYLNTNSENIENELIELLSKYFITPKNKINIKLNLENGYKVIEVD